MQKNKDELYELVKDLLTKKEYTEQIRETKKKYEGLLNDDAIALLVVDELGRNKLSWSKVSGIEAGREVMLHVTVGGVEKPREFVRRDGKLGEVVGVNVFDDSGSCRLTLWDDDVDLVKKGVIKEGVRLKIIDCYAKRSIYGVEITRGRWGLLVVDS